MAESKRDDLLEGAGEIALFLFGDANKRRKVYHLAEKRQLPLFRLGDILCARKTTLLGHIAEQERSALATKMP